jgi:phosphoribosylformylglycinamidine synthase subunit PurL
LAEACRFFDVPVTGGNVSLYNETLGAPILPTPVVGIVGTLPTGPPVGIRFLKPGRHVILLGGIGQSDVEDFGGTQYAKVIVKALWGKPPVLDMQYEKRVQETIRELVRDHAVESAHDVGEGGLAVALAECCFGDGALGIDVNLESSLPPELLLFHEAPSRVLVSTNEPDPVFSVAQRNNVEAVTIGATVEAGFIIRRHEKVLINASLSELCSAWDQSLEHLLHTSESVRINV